MPDFAKG